MNDAKPFLKAIAADPESDLPRLIYADWLEEQGNPRGDLIRAQCELERIGAFEPRAGLLAGRVTELEIEFGQEWIDPVVQLGALHAILRRGFIDEIKILGADFLRYGGQYFDAAPLLKTIAFQYAGPDLEEICQLPPFQRLTGVKLKNTSLTSPLLQVLVEHLNPAKTRFLGLSVADIDSHAARELARCEQLRELESLDLRYNQIRQMGAVALLTSDNLSSLRRIDLRSNRIGQSGFTAIANSPAMARLEWVDISENRLDPDWLGAVKLSAAFPSLKVLDLSENSLKPAGVRRLIGCKFFARLNRLDIRRTGVGNTGAIVLAGSSECENLVQLDLRSNLIGDTGARAIADSRHFSSLKSLDLSDNCIHDLGIRAILESPWMDRLAMIDLRGNEFSSQLAAALINRFGDKAYCESPTHH